MNLEKIFQKAWKIYKNNFLSVVGGYFLLGIISLLVFTVFSFPSLIHASPLLVKIFLSTHPLSEGEVKELVFQYLSSINLSAFLIPLILGAILGVLVFIVLQMGYLSFLVRLGKGKRAKATIREIFEDARYFALRALAQFFLSILIGLTFFVPPILSAVFRNHLVTAVLLFLGITGIVIVFFFLTFWEQCIVIYDAGVIEAMKRSYRKVRKNIFDTLLLLIIIWIIAIAVSMIESVIPLIPSLLFTPYAKIVYIEACKTFKER